MAEPNTEIPVAVIAWTVIHLVPHVAEVPIPHVPNAKQDLPIWMMVCVSVYVLPLVLGRMTIAELLHVRHVITLVAAAMEVRLMIAQFVEMV
jgi:hypothetical protein